MLFRFKINAFKMDVFDLCRFQEDGFTYKIKLFKGNLLNSERVLASEMQLVSTAGKVVNVVLVVTVSLI